MYVSLIWYSVQVLHKRLSILVSKGLIYKLDNYYFPTDKAIELLNYIKV